MKIKSKSTTFLLTLSVFISCQGTDDAEQQESENNETAIDTTQEQVLIASGQNYQWFQNEAYLTGLKDTLGNVLVEAQFNCAGQFVDGWAAVSGENFNGFCDTLGNLESLPPGIKFSTGFSELGGSYHFFDKRSERQYIITNNDNSKFGFISVTKEIIVPCKYDFMDEFREGLAVVGLDTNYGYIDTNGVEVIALKYRNASSFSEGYASVQDTSKLFGFINSKDEIIIEPKFYGVGQFVGGLCIIFSAENYGISFIDIKGNIVIEGPFEDAQPFFGETTLVEKNGKCFYINKKGKKTEDASCDGFLGC